MIDFKRHHFDKDIVLLYVYWYLAYPLRYRNFAEMMEEHGVDATIKALKEKTGQKIDIRQIKYLNNPVEQDHHSIKRIFRPIDGI
jgi:transposase-like protein